MTVREKLIYMGAGCGIGVIVGALFASRSGYEIRQTLSDKVNDLTHRVQQKLQSSGITDTATKTWDDVVEKGRDIVSIGKRRLNESIEAGRRKFNESMEANDLAER